MLIICSVGIEHRSISTTIEDLYDSVSFSARFQILTAHRRWKVFRGDASDDKNLLFSVKKSSLIQFKTKLDVFLASNTKEDVCDFKIEGSWFERSCTVYAGDSSTIVAQVHDVKLFLAAGVTCFFCTCITECF